jgi:hypothetical protein
MTPATGKPLIIPSSVISSTLLSNVSAAVASQANPSFPSIEISNLVASNSAHSSSAIASNYNSPPSPILNSENPTDVDIDTSSISSSPLLLQDPDNTSPNPIVQPTFTHIQTRSRTGHSRPKSFSDYKLFYNT